MPAHTAESRSFVQIVKDAYYGRTPLSQAEQLAHAVAQQGIKVQDCPTAHAMRMLRHAFLCSNAARAQIMFAECNNTCNWYHGVARVAHWRSNTHLLCETKS